MATAVEPAVALRREATRNLRRNVVAGGTASRPGSLTAVLAATRMRIGGEEGSGDEGGREGRCGAIRPAAASHGLSSAVRSAPPKGGPLTKALASTKWLPIAPEGKGAVTGGGRGGGGGGGGGAPSAARPSGESPRTMPRTPKGKHRKAVAAAEPTADPMGHYTPIYRPGKERKKPSFDIDEPALKA